MEREFERLFWGIFNCNGEDELHNTVLSDSLLRDSKNWFPYGGKDKDDRSNFATFENQQAHSGAALVEKITNAIDALLLKKCKQENIDPKSQNAPRTMEEATEKFFDIPKGDIGELLSQQRTKMARENLQVIATGKDQRSDLMIYDNGEGQHPNNFKNTFLSLNNNNKTDITFVQGKYNMGSTGAVVFCGEYRYQLIASKMDNEVFNQEKKHTENLFGWTIVRRHILTEEENEKFGSSWYEYFAIDGKQIPQFEIEELDIGLSDDKKFATGSFVKLFSYEMPKGAKDAIFSGLYQEFNQLLYKPALPFWLLEKREKYKNRQKKDIAVYGNHVRINGPDREGDLLERAPIYERFQDSDIGTVIIQAIIFKKGQDTQQQGNRKRRYIGSGRSVIYILNGQMQGAEGQSFIAQNLKYRFLKDSMLVVIDCSKIKSQFRQDLFMANRSNLKQTEKLEKLNNKVIEILKGNSDLRELNTMRKENILHGINDTKEKELIESLLSKVPLDKSLTDLLKRGVDLTDLPSDKQHTPKRGKEEKRPKQTKRFPSIFKVNIKESCEGKKIKSIPLNGKGIIQFETDVAEDYFYRTQEKGEFQIHILGSHSRNETDGGTDRGKPNKVEDLFEVTQSGPSGSSIKLTLTPKTNLNVGDEIQLNARLTSPDGDIESIFYVKIIDPQRQEKQKIGKEPGKPELPRIIKIKRQENGKWVKDDGTEWKEVENWDEDNILHIMPEDESNKKIISAIAINMSSHSLQKYLSKNKAGGEKKMEFLRSQYVSKVCLHGLFLYSILEKLKLSKKEQDRYSSNHQNNEDLVANIFKSYSDILLYLDTNAEILSNLGDE